MAARPLVSHLLVSESEMPGGAVTFDTWPSFQEPSSAPVPPARPPSAGRATGLAAHRTASRLAEIYHCRFPASAAIGVHAPNQAPGPAANGPGPRGVSEKG